MLGPLLKNHASAMSGRGAKTGYTLCRLGCALLIAKEQPMLSHWLRLEKKRPHRRPRHEAPYRLSVEPLEERRVPSTFNSITETGNNQATPDWGTAGTDLIRIAPSAYADGLNAPAVG